MSIRSRKTILGSVASLATLLVSGLAFAADGAGGADNAATVMKFVALACGFGIAVAAFGGALGQGKAASAALDGIARNPSASDKLFTPMILALALIESLVIYALVISFTLIGNIKVDELLKLAGAQ